MPERPPLTDGELDAIEARAASLVYPPTPDLPSSPRRASSRPKP